MSSVDGVIIKGIGGFYYVKTADGLIECKARGIFRNRGLVPVAGDYVKIDSEERLITDICNRKNRFARPPVANVDCIVIVVSTVLPKPDCFIIDKLTVISLSQGIMPIIVFTKCDEIVDEAVAHIYRSAGFTVLDCSFGSDLTELKNLIKGKVTVFTGNSGAGKSSLLNRLSDGLGLATQQSSEYLGRGKHTTREVCLYDFEGGYVADTPGFSVVDINSSEQLRYSDLAALFPDFATYIDGCYFNDCSHTSEKGCALLEALKNGKIEPTRHDSYVKLFKKAKEMKDWD